MHKKNTDYNSRDGRLCNDSQSDHCMPEPRSPGSQSPDPQSPSLRSETTDLAGNDVAAYSNVPKEALIACQNLSFSYGGKGGKLAVAELNFAVYPGDYLCIVGPNGSGKSTLVRGLLRLLAPTSGKIIFAEGFEREHLGYLPQRIELSKNFPASVGEVVLTGRLSKRGLRPFFSKTDKAIAAACLQRLHAGELAQRNFSELSGGQQQRVLLARALCAAEQLLVLDEPAAGLDPNLQAELEQIILSLNREQGMTVIMVSHDVQSALLHAGKILHLDTRQVFFGSTTEYRKSGAGDGFIGCVHEVNASSRVRASEQ